MFWETEKRKWLGDFHLRGGVIPQVVPLIPAHRTCCVCVCILTGYGKTVQRCLHFGLSPRLWVHCALRHVLELCPSRAEGVLCVCSCCPCSGTRRVQRGFLPAGVCSVCLGRYHDCGFREYNPAPPARAGEQPQCPHGRLGCPKCPGSVA